MSSGEATALCKIKRPESASKRLIYLINNALLAKFSTVTVFFSKETELF